MAAPPPVLAIGLVGQTIFASRTLLQWAASERARRSLVPRWFWHLSLAGSACVVTYSLLVRDPVFLLSVLPQSFIYARNLFVRRPQGRARLLPQAAALVVFAAWAALAKPELGHAAWAVVGVAGSLLWTGRFVVQWWTSERRGESILPAAFWILSLAGTLLLLCYAIHRRDLVMILGYAIGPAAYTRNLVLIRRARRVEAT